MRWCGVYQPFVLTSLADLPSRTGLGSSGAFGCSLLQAIRVLTGRESEKGRLAEVVSKIEIEKLNEPVGRQDQYASAFGGISALWFSGAGATQVHHGIADHTVSQLQQRLCLFFTGEQRLASAVLQDQDAKTKAVDKDMIENLHRTKERGLEAWGALRKGDLYLFGQIMLNHWLNKKRRSPGMTNPRIDHLYDVAIRNGAIGGKLVGAGGGGYLLFLAEDPVTLRNAMSNEGIDQTHFRFDWEGTKVILR